MTIFPTLQETEKGNFNKYPPKPLCVAGAIPGNEGNENTILLYPLSSLEGCLSFPGQHSYYFSLRLIFWKERGERTMTENVSV